MKISINEDGFLLEEVYSGIGLKTRHGEFMGICMRDTGFEFNYNGVWYEAKNNIVKKMKAIKSKKIKDCDSVSNKE